ncbi:hypothetical protein GF377_02475 [candidate division GN15 bacterium]|nr:hypothetical protein [candidate division GN15 bacterium]
MNDAHLHLLLNDIPVLGTVSGIVFIMIGLVARKETFKLIGCWVLLIAGLAAIPVVVTGEGAEEVIEHLQDVDEDIIHEHEEAAELVYPFAIIMGVGGLATIIVHKHVPKLRKTFVFSLLGLAIVVAGMIAWTANLGGQIRHPEVRPGFEQEMRDLKFDGE